MEYPKNTSNQNIKPGVNGDFAHPLMCKSRFFKAI